MTNATNGAAKVAVVTGGGTGIGKAMTRALATAGWTVAITGRRREVLEATAAELSAEGGATIVAIPADIGDDASVENLFKEVIRRLGRLDLLVNNAGVNAPAKPLEELTAAEWHTVVAANLTGVFLCTKEAVKIFKGQSPQGGRIINNGSISATTPRPNSAPYAATKHGVSGLTKATSLEGRRFDIACGQIDIGNAASEMTTTIRKGVLQADGTTIAPEATIDPKLVADAVVYIAGLPLDANVLTMTVMANKMPFVGRG